MRNVCVGKVLELIDFIKNKVINITQEDVLERLLDRKRWPKNYLDGQPSVEAINIKIFFIKIDT